MLPQKIKVRITDNEMADALRTALPDMTSADIENLQKDTRILEHLRATHGWILNEINALLYKHDLEGIVFDGHFQEYELEASKILLQMPDCASVDACQSVIHAVMVKSFSGRVSPLPDYAELAKDVWQVWRDATGQAVSA